MVTKISGGSLGRWSLDPLDCPSAGPWDSGEGPYLRRTLEEAPVGFPRPARHQVLPQRRLPALGGQCENPIPVMSL